MEINTINAFDGKELLYDSGREGYSNSLIEDLYNRYGLSDKTIVADIASGTGIFAEQMLLRNSKVYCIEPNDMMRRICSMKLKEYKNCIILKGRETNTNIKDNEVDIVSVAQAFHWFNHILFRKECQRILHPHGLVLLVWNVRNVNCCPALQRIYEIQKEFCPYYKGKIMKDNDKRMNYLFGGEYERLDYNHPLIYNREQFINRHLSCSYSLTPDDYRFNEYKNRIGDVFDVFAEGDSLTIPNKTIAYIGTV